MFVFLVLLYSEAPKASKTVRGSGQGWGIMQQMVTKLAKLHVFLSSYGTYSRCIHLHSAIVRYKEIHRFAEILG